MNLVVSTLCSFSLLWLAGCASIQTNPKLVGTYIASGSEELAVESDGRVFHSQKSNGRESRLFLGYYGSSSNNPFELGFVGPDTSPFVGTSFKFTEDGSTVTARWNDLRRLKDSWQITYRKAAKTE